MTVGEVQKENHANVKKKLEKMENPPVTAAVPKMLPRFFYSSSSGF